MSATRRARGFACASSCAALAAAILGCSVPSGAGLPIVGRGPTLAPVEGVEDPDLGAGSRGALLRGRGDAPIEVRFLPDGATRLHAIRGDLAALAGPAPDGRFVYAVADDRPGLALRRAHVRGGDAHVARIGREIRAIAIATDGRTAAILAPAAAGGAGAALELVLLDLDRGASRASGLACLPATPAWVDAARVAVVRSAADGSASVALVDARDPARALPVAPGGRVVADPSGAALVVLTRDDGRIRAERAPLDGGALEPLVARGVLEPLALLDSGLLVAYSSPTLAAEPQWELDWLGPARALATIKLHDTRTGAFRTIEPRASSRSLWSAGRLDPSAGD